MVNETEAFRYLSFRPISVPGIYETQEGGGLVYSHPCGLGDRGSLLQSLARSVITVEQIAQET